jgi:hypothetical protein
MRSPNTTPRGATQAGFQSFNWLRGVLDDKRISIIHRAILVRLVVHRQKDGRCDPGYDAVAKELGVDRKTVMRAVDVGVRFGWLSPPIRGRRANANFIFIFANQEVPPEKDFLSNQEVPFSELRSPSKRVKKSLKKVASRGKSKASTEHGHITGKENGQKNIYAAPADASLFKEESLPSGEQVEKSEPETNSERDERFEEFWRAYPRKVAKEAARRAFAAAGVDPELLIAGAKRYANERAGEDPKFTKHPATWLNKGCWEDEASSPNGVVLDGATGELVVAAPAAPAPRKTRWEQLCEEYMAERGNAIIN